MATVVASRNGIRSTGVARSTPRVLSSSSPAVARAPEMTPTTIAPAGATTDTNSAFVQPSGVASVAPPRKLENASGKERFANVS